jgi:phosphatidate cytidylyltransferase
MARLKNLGVRTASALVMIAVVVAAILLRGPLLMALTGVAAALAAHEFYAIARRAGYVPWYPVGIATTLLLCLRGYLGGDIAAGLMGPGPGFGAEVMVLAVVLVLVLGRLGLEWMRAPQPLVRGDAAAAVRGPFLAWADIGLTLGGALYVGGLLGYAPLLAEVGPPASTACGTAWLFMVLIGTAACDTGAYFVGSLIGKHKMIPHISPGKTWEGLAGGVLGGLVAAVAMSGVLNLDLIQAAALGLLTCAAAVSGDLSESLLKRAAGVKDSGNIIPGHGGVLDRIDSILFVLPATYLFATIVH